MLSAMQVLKLKYPPYSRPARFSHVAGGYGLGTLCVVFV